MLASQPGELQIYSEFHQDSNAHSNTHSNQDQNIILPNYWLIMTNYWLRMTKTEYAVV